MLTEVFPKIAEGKLVRALRAYFRSGWHIGVVTVLMVCAEVFAWEIPVYYCYLAIGILMFLFAEDMRGLICIACCGYMTFSPANSPDRNPNTTAFARPEVQLQLYMILAVAVLFMIARLVTFCMYAPKKRAPRLAIGFAVLGVSYLLGGAFSKYYGTDTVLFGAVQIFSVCLFYFFFYYAVDWKSVEKGYWAKLFAIIGAGLVLEISDMYFNPGVMQNGVVVRWNLYTGWANYNVIGCVMAMCIPAVLYFAATQKCGFIYTVLSAVFFLAVLLTQSRGSALFGAVIYLVGLISVIVKSRGWERGLHVIALLALAAVTVVCTIVFFDEIEILFHSLFQIKADGNGRKPLFEKAWAYFLAHPVFGVGWGGDGWLEGMNFLGFFKAHNTVLQLLATGGIVMAVAYAVHRFQTFWVAFRRPTAEKYFVVLSFGVIILTGFMDCHFFNIGPAILYSILLVLMEGADLRGGNPQKQKLRGRR